MPYDKLVEAVANGTYDAAVADITITANRSMQVDFTQHFLTTAIAMMVRLHDQRSSSNRSTWVFFKPLSFDLWLVSGAFFLFTGFVVWAIERRHNADFRGTRSNQAGTIFYFGFSTLVFAQKKELKSNLSRFAVVVWVFVVLILQSSYTASLTSMLTVPQLEPVIKDYAELLRGTEKVGIMNNSFTQGAMLASGFPQGRLVRYQTLQSFYEALLNGSIDVIINETPYFKVFPKSYRNNFTMAGQLNRTGGLAFAFPKGSPYVSDLSHAILKLTENDEMNKIERKWFGDDNRASQGEGPFTSKGLRFDNFWGLFLITGTTSLLCCFVYLVTFVMTNWRTIIVSHLSWKGRLKMLAKLFDDKDPSVPAPHKCTKCSRTGPPVMDSDK